MSTVITIPSFGLTSFGGVVVLSFCFVSSPFLYLICCHRYRHRHSKPFRNNFGCCCCFWWWCCCFSCGGGSSMLPFASDMSPTTNISLLLLLLILVVVCLDDLVWIYVCGVPFYLLRRHCDPWFF